MISWPWWEKPQVVAEKVEERGRQASSSARQHACTSTERSCSKTTNVASGQSEQQGPTHNMISAYYAQLHHCSPPGGQWRWRYGGEGGPAQRPGSSFVLAAPTAVPLETKVHFLVLPLPPVLPCGRRRRKRKSKTVHCTGFIEPVTCHTALDWPSPLQDHTLQPAQPSLPAPHGQSHWHAAVPPAHTVEDAASHTHHWLPVAGEERRGGEEERRRGGDGEGGREGGGKKSRGILL